MSWKKTIESRSQRERLTVALALVCLMIFASDRLVFTPIWTSMKSLRSQQNALIEQKRQMQDALLKSGSLDQSVIDLQKQLTARQTEYQAIEPLVQAARQQLIAPEQVGPFMRNILPKDGRIRLIQLKSLSAQKNASVPDLFEHPFVVALSGSYADLTSYVKQLQASPWRLQLQRMNLASDEKTTPMIAMTLYVNAYSDSPEWLGKMPATITKASTQKGGV